MKLKHSAGSTSVLRLALILLVLVALTRDSAKAGTWTPLVRTAPGGINLMLVLSDGTIMCANNNGSSIGSGWFRLTPDSVGSYINGTWTTLASAHDTRLYYSTQVLM